jgi:hypothetical protein
MHPTHYLIILFRGFVTLVVPLPPLAYREVQSFFSEEAGDSNFITILLSRGIFVVLIVFVVVSRLNSAVRSARCVRPGQLCWYRTYCMLGSDRTRTDINGEQKRSADYMCGGGGCMANRGLALQLYVDSSYPGC